MSTSPLRYTEVARRTLDRPPPFVVAAAAAESGLKLENVSHGQLQVLSAVPAENAALAMAGGQGSLAGLKVVTPPPIMEGRGVVKRFWNGKVHVVPLHADWFCPTRVHSLEKQVGSHFFSGKSADTMTEKYMDFRNSVVAKYMEHPEKRLSISDCLEMADGIDEKDKNRIFHFLEHWGIINYCASVPDQGSWNIDSYLWEDVNGDISEFHVPSAALKSNDCLIKFDKPKCRLKASDAYSLLSSNGDDISELENRIQEKLSGHRCNYCSQPLVLGYYQSMKEGDVMLCLDCYHDGRFVIGHSSMDFSKVDSTKDQEDLNAGIWTDQETVLLLEALEIYNDNWNDIAMHVGSKSAAQCMLHFLQLPVENGLLLNLDVPVLPAVSSLPIRDESGEAHLNSNGNTEDNGIEDSDSYSRLPFINSGNPVMALVAFLSSSLGPRVAAACAHASLNALAEVDGLSPQEMVLPADGSVLSTRTLPKCDSHDERRNSDENEDEISSAQASQSSNDTELSPLSAEKVNSAAKAGLVAAAIKAKLLANYEEREIQRQAAIIASVQLRKLELKLRQFNEVDTFLVNESEQLERTRKTQAAERAIYMTSQSVPPLVANTDTLSRNRPMQLMSTSSFSQPSFSGFGNQMNHPNNMPFMQQQPTFSFGPDVPSSVLPSTSLRSPDLMFNAQGIGQSSFSNYPMLRPIPGTNFGFS